MFGIHGLPDAERKNVFGANFKSCLFCQFSQLIGLLGGCVGRQAGSDDHKFVSAHASDIIVFTASLLQSLSKEAQDAVALQMAKAVVDLFESIHVADHDG